MANDTEPAEPPEEMPAFQKLALALTGVGLALSGMLEQLHIKTHTVPSAEHFCSVGETFDCAAVAASPHAIFLGLPWAIWGAIGFLALGSAAYQRSKWLLPLSAAAAFTSVALFILSAVVIGAVCLLCEGVHLVSIAVFVVAYLNRGQLEGDFKDEKKIASVLGLPFVLATTLPFLIPSYWSAFSYKAAPPFPTGVTEEGHPWIGAEDPAVTIHEYVHYRCPHCKVGSARSLRLLGKHSSWRLVRHQQPMTGCPTGIRGVCQAARMAFCAGQQGHFWRADRWLFAHLKPEKKFDRADMIRDLELDPSAFRECYASEVAYEFNDKAHREANDKGLQKVPSYEITAQGEIPSMLKPLITKPEKKGKKKE